MTKNPTVILHTDVPQPALELVQAAHPDLTLHSCDSYAALPQLITDTQAEVIYSVRFAGTPGFPRDAILGSETIRWVSVGGSGTDNISDWDGSRLTVTNAAGVAANMMAEYTLGAMLHFSLDFGTFAKAQAAHQWSSGKVRPIENRKILIVGMGKTGLAIAERCKALKLHVTGVRARPAPTDFTDEIHGVDDIIELLPKADFIVICVPLLASTRRLIDAAAIRAMKPDAVLIDVSRGGVVDQTALAAALTENRLRGAAIDVFETEPLPDASPLWDLENVILTPHCSSVYDGWELKSVKMFIENLSRYRHGKSLENIVDPNRGY